MAAFTKATPLMQAVREEILGPVVAAMPYEDIDEIAARANDTIYGLAASVWTNDVRKAHCVARALKSGRVGINVHDLNDVTTPTGGYKQSGWGGNSARRAWRTSWRPSRASRRCSGRRETSAAGGARMADPTGPGKGSRQRLQHRRGRRPGIAERLGAPSVRRRGCPVPLPQADLGHPRLLSVPLPRPVTRCSPRGTRPSLA